MSAFDVLKKNDAAIGLVRKATGQTKGRQQIRGASEKSVNNRQSKRLLCAKDVRGKYSRI